MDAEHNDPILDACLSEVLGGHTPPDLTDRIVNARANAAHANTGANNAATVTAAANFSQVVVTQPSVSLPAGVNSFAPHKARYGWWAAAAIGVAAAVVGVAFTISLATRSNPTGQQIAANPAAPQPTVAPVTTDSTDPQITEQPATPEPVAVAPTTPEPPVEPTTPPVPPTAIATAPATKAKRPAVSPQPAPLPEKRIVALSAPLKREQSSDESILTFVNAEFTQSWKTAGIRPTTAIADAEWCQRVFARVIGRNPTAEELKSFTDDKSTTRREKLVRRLLTDKAYADEYVSRWAAIWTQAFAGRGSVGPNAAASREDLQKYFTTALTANKPYSVIVTDLLTATGSPRPGADDYNPAVNFLLDGMTPDATATTGRVSRLLLGNQLQCAQCHDHPTESWTQDQFWGLNACFRQVRLNRRDGTPRLISVRRVANAAVSYEDREGQSKTATPHFIDGTELKTTGTTSGTDLMRSLAQAITQSDDFCRSAVNRVWAQLFDYGFTRPLDDLGPKSNPADREILDRLAGEFATHNYDLKALIQWAVLSEPFTRSSKFTDLASKDIPEAGEVPLFSRFYARPAKSADAFAVLTQSTRMRSSGVNDRDIAKARTDWLTQANRSSTNNVPANAKKPVTTAPPAIVVKAVDPLQKALTIDPDGLIKRLAASSMTFDRKIEHVTLALAGRQPTPRERRVAAELLHAAQDREAVALEDLWWSIQNSSESVFDR